MIVVSLGVWVCLEAWGVFRVLGVYARDDTGINPHPLGHKLLETRIALQRKSVRSTSKYLGHQVHLGWPT